ncbi:hypothetical protein, partial [Phreatobacter sp. AB_2022a]|uniref:hypothetical protein n=1 Tax=Phreatobacter sp. AB_2022a TaxID=3003134 RepID=UPI0022870FA9
MAQEIAVAVADDGAAGLLDDHDAVAALLPAFPPDIVDAVVARAAADQEAADKPGRAANGQRAGRADARPAGPRLLIASRIAAVTRLRGDIARLPRLALREAGLAGLTWLARTLAETGLSRLAGLLPKSGLARLAGRLAGTGTAGLARSLLTGNGLTWNRLAGHTRALLPGSLGLARRRRLAWN